MSEDHITDFNLNQTSFPFILAFTTLIKTMQSQPH